MAKMREDLDYDVAIIGAGVSGINTAYRLQTQASKGTTIRYAIFEMRKQIGGTWDLFRYPGIRSDSDLHTFGFAWRPWTEKNTIATASSIVKYLEECADVYGIDRNIRFGHKLVRADWSSEALCWTLECVVKGQESRTFRAGFVVMGTGYYDYEKPFPAVIPGIENFKGQVVHPQFWPEDLNYKHRDVVIIGSGATAVTLLPALAKDANKVTQLQRSPTYVVSASRQDKIGPVMKRILPASFAAELTRYIYIVLGYWMYYWCTIFPETAKASLKKKTKQELPTNLAWDPHFKPRYNPWEQRLCLCPDGDYFEALRSGKGDVVTGVIEEVTEDAIRLTSGQELRPDLIVTATGLQLLWAGGATFSVDGVRINAEEKLVWKGMMLQDVPNAAFVMGYTNASWTLGADATAHMITRLLKYMHEHSLAAAIPTLDHGQKQKMKRQALLNLTSTYIESGRRCMPQTGEGQWARRSNWFQDMREAKRGDMLSDLEFCSKKQHNGRL
jgi:cation diffusion facilitator CzcD-associated flavoprotein CzcO